MMNMVKTEEKGIIRNEAGKESNLYTKRNNSPLLSPDMHKGSKAIVYDYRKVLGGNRTGL